MTDTSPPEFASQRHDPPPVGYPDRAPEGVLRRVHVLVLVVALALDVAIIGAVYWAVRWYWGY